MSRLFTSCLLTLVLVFSAGATPKNILLIIADDYGADSSSLYNSTNTGASLPPTPTIVSLAQSGMVFRNAYAYPVCSPTRACLLTGRYGFRTGIGDVIVDATSPALTAAEFTLPEAFAANPALGYQLAHFGKWHLSNGPKTPNTIGGWPHYAGNLIGELANYTNWTKTIDGTSTPNNTNYATTDLVNDATTWIQSQGSSPWFAWIAFNAPHTPLHLPPTNLCPHYATLPGTTHDINTRPRQYFEAMVEAMDTEMNRLLSSVNRSNTQIIFLGDNGTVNTVLQPPYPATRGKGSLYEGGVRVPFIISGPAVTNPGQTNDTPVNMVDVFSTILEMAGINVAATVPTNVVLDSQSLLSLAQSNSSPARYGFSEFFGDSVAAGTGGRTLRNNQFKLMAFNDGHQEFYNLAADPYEGTNLLSTMLTSTQQSNYYSLVLHLGAYQDDLANLVISNFNHIGNQFTMTVQRNTNMNYSLWRATTLEALAWAPLTNAVVSTNSPTIVTLSDTNAAIGQNFYRAVATTF